MDETTSTTGDPAGEPVNGREPEAFTDARVVVVRASTTECQGSVVSGDTSVVVAGLTW